MPKEITIKLTFDKTWDNYAEENIADDFYVIDAIRDLAPGVVWQIQPQKILSFIDDYITGKAKISDIDDYIEDWHNNDSPLALYEYLGMNAEEFEQYLKDESEVLKTIIKKYNK